MTEPAAPGDRGVRAPMAPPAREGLATIRRRLERLSLIGVVPEDSDDVRVQKVTLTVSAVTVTVLSVFWVVTYLALGRPVSAAIPFAYQVASVVTLIAFARTTSRMESHGVAGRIQVTEATYQRLRERYRFEDRGETEVKGKGRIRTYLLIAPGT